MTETRPALTPTLAAADFRSFYWLKEELILFCRAEGLSVQGSKQDLAERIAHFLETGRKIAPTTRPAQGKMPASFTRETIISQGWRCTEGLRAFFQAEIGSHFHFNQVMRNFIAQGQDKTLQEAIDAWQTARQNPTQTDIAPQFEYNRHMRAYYQQHPNATRDEVLASWKALRAERRMPETETSE